VKRLARDLKRPFGVAALDITEVFNGAATFEKDSFAPVLLCGESDSLDSALRKLLTNKECSQRDQGLWLTVKLLFGDAKQAIKENPHIISHSAVIAKKMGFPDIISPGDLRNDLYVTLCEAEFKKGMRFIDKNIEVTAMACNSSGRVLDKVIIEGAGSREKNSYRSVVYYHENKPKWNETFKVAIPIADFIDAHLKFTFRHRSSSEAKDKTEKLLAVAYVRLMLENGTTLPDGVHDLIIYSVDGRRIDDTSTYLQLPSTVDELQKLDSSSSVHHGHLKMSKGNSFTVSTLLCSTKLANNVDLLHLLKWREHPEQLRQGLQALMKVGADEIMKFLEDVLDVLFNILMQYSDSDEYDGLVFDALNYILNIVLDQKYLYFRPVLDAYITDNFSATLAYNKLLAVLKANITSALRGQQTTATSLMRALSSFEYVIKFIVRSRVLYAALNNGREKQQFESSLTHVFDSLNLLMVDKSDASIAMQEAALKYLPVTTANLLTVWDVSNVASIMVRFITSIPPDKLKKQKLQFINDIIRGPLFLIPEGRSVVLSPIVNLIQRYLEDGEELELCAKILSDILDLLSQLDSLETAPDIEVIIMSSFRAVIQVTISIDRVFNASLAGSYVAIMIEVLRQMVDHHYTLYLSHFETKIDLLDFLTEILMVFRDLTSKSVFPPDWTDMILLQSSTFAKALKHFAKVIVQKFLTPFEYQVWNNYFHCSISFITQDSLQVSLYDINSNRYDFVFFFFVICKRNID
jgi:dedicator of cytokinesis protein 1